MMSTNTKSKITIKSSFRVNCRSKSLKKPQLQTISEKVQSSKSTVYQNGNASNEIKDFSKQLQNKKLNFQQKHKINQSLQHIANRVFEIQNNLKESLNIGTKSQNKICSINQSKSSKKSTEHQTQFVQSMQSQLNTIIKSFKKIQQLIHKFKVYRIQYVQPANIFQISHQNKILISNDSVQRRFGIIHPLLCRQKSTTINIKILQDCQTCIGIGFKNIIQKNQYEWKVQHKRGYYVIEPSQGCLYQHQKTHKKIKHDYLKGQIGDELKIAFDPINKKLIFENITQRLNSCEIKIDIPQNDDVHFVIFSADPSTKVQIEVDDN